MDFKTGRVCLIWRLRESGKWSEGALFDLYFPIGENWVVGTGTGLQGWIFLPKIFMMLTRTYNRKVHPKICPLSLSWVKNWWFISFCRWSWIFIWRQTVASNLRLSSVEVSGRDIINTYQCWTDRVCWIIDEIRTTRVGPVTRFSLNKSNKLRFLLTKF